MPLSLFSFSLISMFFTIYLVLAQRSSIISMHFAAETFLFDITYKYGMDVINMGSPPS